MSSSRNADHRGEPPLTFDAVLQHCPAAYRDTLAGHGYCEPNEVSAFEGTVVLLHAEYGPLSPTQWLRANTIAVCAAESARARSAAANLIAFQYRAALIRALHEVSDWPPDDTSCEELAADVMAGKAGAQEELAEWLGMGRLTVDVIKSLAAKACSEELKLLERIATEAEKRKMRALRDFEEHARTRRQVGRAAQGEAA